MTGKIFTWVSSARPYAAAAVCIALLGLGACAGGSGGGVTPLVSQPAASSDSTNSQLQTSGAKADAVSDTSGSVSSLGYIDSATSATEPTQLVVHMLAPCDEVPVTVGAGTPVSGPGWNGVFELHQLVRVDGTGSCSGVTASSIFVKNGAESPSPLPSATAAEALASVTPTASPTTKPTAAPTAAPTKSPVATVAGDFLGCPYPSGDVYQTNISSAALATDSAQMIQATYDAISAMGKSQSFNVWTPTNNLSVNSATNATPLVPVAGTVSYHTPYSPVPWLSAFEIEPGSDAHSLVLNTQSCVYYEGYGTSYSGNELHEYNGSSWNLTKPFARPSLNPGSTASGIPVGLLAVRPEELTAGVIQHALGYDAAADAVAPNTCVSPAAQSDCGDGLAYKGPASDVPYEIPYGAHIRLKSSVNISGWPREAQIVATALQTYGAYLYDTGCCNAIPMEGDVYGAPTWTSADETAIATLTINDFDVVQAP